MTFKTTRLRDAIVFALLTGAVSALGTGAAFAQTQSSTPKDTSQTGDAKQLDNIVVTGTRILSQTVTSSSPVAEIQKEQFKVTGATRVEDLVNQYPQLSPSFDSFTNNGSTGYGTVDLRGLGSQRTLTLVNGYRLPEGALVGARDISIVPAAAIKRVDILTGGASAVYGSDAIAGVVNFILDDEFEGVNLSAGYSAYQHNNDNRYVQGLERARGFKAPSGNSGFGGISRNVDLVVGSAFAEGQGHAMAWATYRQNDALFQGERDYSACSLNAGGTGCGGSNTNAAGNFYAYQLTPTGDVGASTNAHLQNGKFVPGYGAPYNYAPINYYQRPDTRYTFGTTLKYEINEHFRPFLETMYVNHRSSTQVAESGAFFTALPPLPCNTAVLGTFCSDLGFDPTQPVNVYVAKRNVEGGPRHTDSETNQFRVVAGVEGDLGEAWKYNVSYVYGHTSQDTVGRNDFLTSRIVSAILGCPAGSFTGCIPYSVFTGSVSPQAAASLAGVSTNKTSTELKAFNAYVTGDTGLHLPWVDKNAQLVMGVESREESYSTISDTNSAEGNFAGSGGKSPPLSGKVSVDEIFLESAVPLLRDAGLLKSLDLDLGYRLSDYNRSGRANTYKVGMTADLGMFRLRSGYNHAIRAPNVSDLFSAQSLQLFQGADPCAGPTPTATAAQCALTGVSAARYGLVPNNSAGQFNQFTGGNPNLTPEIGNTFTFGVVATPVKNLQLSADYFDVKLKNAITTVGANTILEQCIKTGNPALCGLIHRNAISGDLFRGTDPALGAGYVTNTTANFGAYRYRGVDLGAFYRWDMLGGRMTTSFNGTYYINQEADPLPGVSAAAKYDCAGRINTSCQANKWRHIASVGYGRDTWSVNLRWRYFDALDYVGNDGKPLLTDKLLCKNTGATGTTACRGNGRLAAQNYFDLSGSMFIGQATEVTLGVNNMLDRAPPLVGNTLATNGNSPGGYDQAGRFFFGSIAFRF